jgi:hypothetical protein
VVLKDLRPLSFLWLLVTVSLSTVHGRLPRAEAIYTILDDDFEQTAQSTRLNASVTDYS